MLAYSVVRIKPFASRLLLISLALVLAQPSRALPGFSPAASLAQARRGHTATLLQNGNVLVAGGDDATSYLNSAELFVEFAGWTTTGSLANRRSHHTATLLPNGKVLVTGGFQFALFFTFALSSAELYDPASGTWSATADLIQGRFDHTATLLPNGKVLVVGGAYSDDNTPEPIILGTAELYDPDSGLWSHVGSLHTSRRGHTATLLPNGKVLVASGQHGAATAELYDPASGTWTETGSLIFGRQSHTATLRSDGTVLVAGGAGGLESAELYDPESESWSRTADLTAARAGHTATLLPNHTVLAAGGDAAGTIEIYFSDLKGWGPSGSMMTARSGHTATSLLTGEVLIVGGQGTDGTVLASAEFVGGSTRPPDLLNISTRMNVLAGDNAMIGGTIVTGSQGKAVIVRGVGPSLGIPGALADPVVEIHGSSGELLASNDNWREGFYAAQVANTLPPANDLESALWAVLAPGAYTFVLRGKGDTTGIALFEAYDLDQTTDCKLANISTRGFVGTDDNVLVGGIIIGGGFPGSPVTILLRALGPSIPVAGALADPTLELHDGNGTMIAFNDNWRTNQVAIESTGIPPTNDSESALLEILFAGNYTAIVRGVNGATGVALVEAYKLQ